MAKQQSNTRERTRERNAYPMMYMVIMHNDDFTTMEFVVKVLKSVFHKDDTLAEQLMLTVHRLGQAVVGIYTLDVASSKRDKAMRMAREEGFPFKMTIEPEDLPC